MIILLWTIQKWGWQHEQRGSQKHFSIIELLILRENLEDLKEEDTREDNENKYL